MVQTLAEIKTGFNSHMSEARMAIDCANLFHDIHQLDKLYDNDMIPSKLAQSGDIYGHISDGIDLLKEWQKYFPGQDAEDYGLAFNLAHEVRADYFASMDKFVLRDIPSVFTRDHSSTISAYLRAQNWQPSDDDNMELDNNSVNRSMSEADDFSDRMSDSSDPVSVQSASSSSSFSQYKGY